MTEYVKIDPGVLEEILTGVFSEVVNLPLEASADAARKPTPPPYVTAIVGLIGSARYAVVLQTTEKLACRIAGGMVGEKLSEWSSSVEDAFAELTNITAGNLKTCLAEGLLLSMPTVIHGREYSWCTPKMHILHESTFVCEGEILKSWIGVDG